MNINPRVHCVDGFNVSIQRNEFAYCDLYSYASSGTPLCFELGFPSEPDNLLSEYAEYPERPTETVYGYVPHEVVQQLIEKHGGIEYGRIPLDD